MSITGGAAVAIAGGVLIVGAGSALLLELWLRLLGRHGLPIQVAVHWWRFEANEEIHRRAEAADTKMFARMRGQRPVWIGGLVVGIVLVVVGALIDSRAF